MNRIFRLLGCDWGEHIYTRADPHDCLERGAQRIVIRRTNGTQYMVQVCDKHANAIYDATDEDNDYESC